MTSLEEKKKVWEAQKAKKIAERMAKAEAWRAEAKALRAEREARKQLRKGMPEKPPLGLPRVIEKLKKIERKPVEKSLEEAVKLKMEKIFPKKKERKKPKPRKKKAGEEPPAALMERIADKVKEIVNSERGVKREKEKRKGWKKKIKEIGAAKAEIKKRKRKKRVKKKIKLRPKVKKKAVKPAGKEEELIAAVLKEPLPREGPKIEKAEEELVETSILTGLHTEISMPKTKEGAKLDWSTRRFGKLEEKLKKLRRF